MIFELSFELKYLQYHNGDSIVVAFQVAVTAKRVAGKKSLSCGLVKDGKAFTGNEIRNQTLVLLLLKVPSGFRADFSALTGGAVAVDYFDGRAAPKLAIAYIIGDTLDCV